MDFKNYRYLDNKIIVKKTNNFVLKHIFENGQCFRWERTNIGTYIIVAKGRVIELEMDSGDLIIHNSNVDDFENIWINYFDFERDYCKLKGELKHDKYLDIAINFGHGLRILNQDPFEMILSFIISSNNRIPMIKKAILSISEKYGDPISYKGRIYYKFPSLENLANLSQEKFRECSVGFRDKYLYNTVKLLNEDNDIEYIMNLNDDMCHKELQKFSGVGSKVSDCIMLFSMKKYSAFPVDVWVKRAMMKFYVAPDTSLKGIRDFGRELFKDSSGLAQQYLFYYVRENNIKV
ncbi:8-oxoguanine-DNA-glycosylase [Candidatus Arthromitus sp. SFB-mouse-NL]|uniref:DNA-3-methyladenine glycosylase family protein n=1 Tax=Candidatus Arthromitus sp. SFB-mouse-NL TaxID=1508644 RepID=UPI00049ADD3D|nr:DNA glycosylase [Candidatus Arthromitus sp. SFB-mouse-NL]AID44273.1 8-oxoguanine-DNA-glycosylase [Candidatus Arthromitus sp. SFB-mouse-NL]